MLLLCAGVLQKVRCRSFRNSQQLRAAFGLPRHRFVFLIHASTSILFLFSSCLPRHLWHWWPLRWLCAGYKISNGTMRGLVQRYSNKKGQIEFDDFIHCVARMKTMFSKNPFNNTRFMSLVSLKFYLLLFVLLVATFNEMKRPSGKAEFSMDEVRSKNNSCQQKLFGFLFRFIFSSSKRRCTRKRISCHVTSRWSGEPFTRSQPKTRN